MSDHSTRCAWIRQNDADSDDPSFMCGAAAAQMILYGRDDSKFQPGNATRLRDTDAQLHADQQRVWRAVVEESRRCRLPAGASYKGVPESDQICEGGACWAAFPDALAATLTRGFTVRSGRVAGVSAKVRAVASEAALERAIVDSLNRGVAAAVLIQGTHWIVVYRYVTQRDGEAKVYYRDGWLPKIESEAPWSVGGFELEVDQLTQGVYRTQYIAVTASARVPLTGAIAAPPTGAIAAPTGAIRRPAATAAPRGAVRRIDADTLPQKPDPQPFPDQLGDELATRNAATAEWERAFAGARVRYVLKVTGLAGTNDYYLVDYAMPDNAAGNGSMRTGTVLVDAYTLRPRMIAGVEERGEALPKIYGPNDLDPVMDRLANLALPIATDVTTVFDRSRLHLDGELVWQPCDQSSTPFLPFYRVRQLDPSGNAQATVYIRIDGRIFRELTRYRLGI